MNEASEGADGESGADVATRWPALITALVLGGIGLTVMLDSLRVGIGWADDGPRAGYFPFYIGLALLLACAWTALTQLRRWSVKTVFATRVEVGRVLTVLWPLVVYVPLIKFLGIYVASAILIVWFMSRHGEHGWPMRAAVALGVPVAFFVLFERWFVVPLPKGPLEAALGF